MAFPDQQPGGWIHSTDPFATPDQDRSPVRRLRGRLATAVTLWTAGAGEGPGAAAGWAGLTVSSTMVADGEPGRLLGLIDPETDLFVAAEATGRFTVAPLRSAHRQLADRFAGLLPAPGGLFRTDRWTPTGYGPVLAELPTWAGCRLDATRPFGWGILMEATIEQVAIGAGGDPLLHFRGRYTGLPEATAGGPNGTAE